ncbi:MAG: hypothetical protein Q9200_005878 [Gallowayella weberi]
MDTLDEMVGANAYSSYLSPQNYQIYSIMVKNECKQYPNLRESPWDPTLIMSNSTTPTPNDSLTCLASEAKGSNFTSRFAATKPIKPENAVKNITESWETYVGNSKSAMTGVASTLTGNGVYE